MPYSSKNFQYGPALVLRGPHKGRVADIDDDTTERGRLHAVVQFAPFGVARRHSLIPVSYLRAPNTQDLFARYEQLWRMLTPYLRNAVQAEERIDALEELAYISGLLNDRMFEAQYAYLMTAHESSCHTLPPTRPLSRHLRSTCLRSVIGLGSTSGRS